MFIGKNNKDVNNLCRISLSLFCFVGTSMYCFYLRLFSAYLCALLCNRFVFITPYFDRVKYKNRYKIMAVVYYFLHKLHCYWGYFFDNKW